MRRFVCLLFVAVAVASASAAPLMDCDFEDYAIGTTWTMWSRYGGGSSTATVVADPTNAANKVGIVISKGRKYVRR